MRGPRGLLLLALALLPGTGCERVGASLVGHRDPDGGGPIRVRCLRGPPCDAELPDYPDPQPRAIRRVDIPATCALMARYDCAFDVVAPDPDGDAPGIVACRLELGLAELDRLDRREVACSRLIIEPEPGAAPSHRLDGVWWTNGNVSFASTAPFLLVLANAELDNVTIETRGPVTLRIIDSRISRLRVQSRDEGELAETARPRIELRAVESDELWIGDEVEFRGSVAVTRATLSHAQLIAQTVELESVLFEDGLIDAGDLTGTDCALLRSAVDATRALLSACRLEEMQVRRCGVLTVAGGEIDRSAVAPCTLGPFRAYGVLVLGSVIDGLVEGDLTNWGATRFGRRAPTDVTVLGGSIRSSALCRQTGAVRLGGSAALACSTCGEGFDPAAVCGDPVLSPQIGSNFCDELENAGVCEAPLQRDRPPITD